MFELVGRQPVERTYFRQFREIKKEISQSSFTKISLNTTFGILHGDLDGTDLDMPVLARNGAEVGTADRLREKYQ